MIEFPMWVVHLAFFMVGAYVYAMLTAWMGRTPKHKHEWVTMYKRKPAIDGDGIWRERCECGLESFSTRRWIGTPREWRQVLLEYRPEQGD